MLNWALIFLLVAIIAGIFGFAGLALAAGLAKFFFFPVSQFISALAHGIGTPRVTVPQNSARPKQI